MLPLISAALLPVLILAFFILRKDKEKPEPAGQLLKSFGLGVLSVIPALLLAQLLAGVGLVPEQMGSVWEALLSSFCGAAIPEESAKLFMLWLVLRRNPYFDEKVDGIVYAVCVSLGFAAAENVLYLVEHAEHYMQVGMARALFAVPGHFCDGVFMGYYYSLARFGSRAPLRHRLSILAAPLLAHGVYDFLLFASNACEYGSALLCLFPFFCYALWRYASRRITRHQVADGVLPR